MNKTSGKISLSDIYRCLYPWKSINEFLEQIQTTIAYKSEDNSLIAINKPFGVGTYTVLDKNSTKQNVDKVLSNLSGSPKYCLSDVLGPLSESLGSPNRYTFVKSIDRYVSGLVLITNNEQHKKNFERATAASRCARLPPFGFRAIASGYPALTSDKSYEVVGVQRVEVDELGDYKEPIITDTHGSTYRRDREKKSFQAELIIKKINKQVSTSLIELYTSSLGWDFPRLYISSKTAFILGDVRFSRRIRQIMGKKMQVSALHFSNRYDDDYEPLDPMLRSTLGLKKNNQIPLMLDLHCLRLKHFNKKTKEDLIIDSKHMPLHFALTAKQLSLIDDEEIAEESSVRQEN